MVKQIGIIGGGIIGIALAREISSRGLGDVTVFEKEDRLAAHQTGHNSGVVHAGLYYPPNSLKAQLCSTGRVAIRDFCLSKGLPYEEVGKLVVAVDETEVTALEEIERRSRLNKVPDLVRLDTYGIREIEPHANGVSALYSPRTAVVDYAMITESMAEDVSANGGVVLLGSEVIDVKIKATKAHVFTASQEFKFDRIVACAGLQSDIVARMVGAPKSPKILPFRGEYWDLAVERRDLVNGMIYPVPDPRFPFLGVHFTRGVYGDVRVGPNAVPALAREGYNWLTFSLKDTFASLTWPGAPSLAMNHWRMGLTEISRSLIKSLYYRQARRFIPSLKKNDLVAKSNSGVRAQAWSSDGSLVDDFVIDNVGPVVVIRNAPSPAATSSVAIADYIVRNHF